MIKIVKKTLSIKHVAKSVKHAKEEGNRKGNDKLEKSRLLLVTHEKNLYEKILGLPRLIVGR